MIIALYRQFINGGILTKKRKKVSSDDIGRAENREADKADG